MNKKNDTFIATDLLNNPLIIEWQQMPGKTDELTQKILNLSDILAPSYAQTETEFARTKPEDVPNDFMLKSLAPLLTTNVDWNLFEQKTKEHLNQFFKSMDWKTGSDAQETHIFVTANDKQSNKTLGMIQFIISPSFAQGSVKAALFGVIPSEQNRGLEKLLMSSIFKLKPETKHIFLHTRTTNVKAIHAYKTWGFVGVEGKLPNWTDVEYLADQSSVLQKTAATLHNQ